MNQARFVDKLNDAIGLELCATLQYYHNAQVLCGADRRIWKDVFDKMRDHGFEDARKFASHVVALGGNPTVQPAPVNLATGVQEMLSNALELERKLVAAYTDALSECIDHPAYRNLLEEQILHETKDVEDLLKYLSQVQPLAGVQPQAMIRSA